MAGKTSFEEVFIPKFGQTVEEVTRIKWRVEEGARVEQGQEILDVETDKAIFSVEAPTSGYLHIGPYKEGDVLPVVTVVAIIGNADQKFQLQEEVVSSRSNVDKPAEANPPLFLVEANPAGIREEKQVFASPRARKLAMEMRINLSQVTPTGGGGTRITEKDVIAFVNRTPRATPVAQRVAQETGLDLRGLTGTGPQGRITKTDVRGVMQQTLPVQPSPASGGLPSLSGPEEIERIPLKGVRALIAERMATSVHTTARVTLIMEVDATEFVHLRQRLEERVTDTWGFAPGYNDLLGKIVAMSLRKFPYMNARLATDAIEILSAVNLGMATDTERGLLVPVIRDADKKSLRQFGIEFRQLVEQAHQGKISPDNLAGGTFTLTNLGQYDVDAFTPVINLPEAAILGIGRIAPKVVPREGQPVIRTMCTLSLVFDHRLVDGAPAARFLQYIKTCMEEPYLWLVEEQDL